MEFNRNQALMILAALALLTFLWYSTNPPKKEKCCGMA